LWLLLHSLFKLKSGDRAVCILWFWRHCSFFVADFSLKKKAGGQNWSIFSVLWLLLHSLFKLKSGGRAVCILWFWRHCSFFVADFSLKKKLGGRTGQFLVFCGCCSIHFLS
jgi:hypothetical protein